MMAEPSQFTSSQTQLNILNNSMGSFDSSTYPYGYVINGTSVQQWLIRIKPGDFIHFEWSLSAPIAENDMELTVIAVLIYFTL